MAERALFVIWTAEAVKQILNGTPGRCRSFIVHGHDMSAVSELKDYLKDDLGFAEPVVLSDCPSYGKTLIEKFEHYARNVDVTFVLLTPDDVGGLAETVVHNRRARQNVVFEYGYFLGVFRRRSGRVILLHKGAVEVPSDLHGIVYIDISQGIRAAARQIRAELARWL